MADDVFVLNEGQAIPTDFTASPSSNIAAGTFNRNTSVNPNIITEAGSNTTALGIHCYEIHSDEVAGPSVGSNVVGSSLVNRLYPKNTTVPSYAENKFDSTNYRVVIDTGSADGIKETGTSHLLGSSSCTRDYFIVIYADNVYKHHVAKITEETLYDGNFYNFDFTPSLKENISAGTKVAIYQGPEKTDNVVAVGYGLLNDIDTTEERHDKYVNVSRPTFYFYEGGSLEPNTKYTALKTSTNSTGPQVSIFKTAPITSDKLLDKSFFTHTAVIVDVNRSNDDDVSQPKGINSYSAVGSNYTFAKATWAQSSLNIYDSDAGLNTYLRFVDSPERTQLLSTPYHLNTSKTVTTRGNQFEAKYYDTERILEHKIRDYENIKIKEIIHTQNVSTIPEGVLPGVFSRKSSTTIEVTGLLVGQDLRTLLYDSNTTVWEPFFVDGYYYECLKGNATKITAPVDGVQTITISNSRAVTSNFWSGSASVHTFSDKTAYRKFYSRVTGTILIGHEIDTEYDGTTITRNGITITETESDIYNLEYSIQGTNYGRTLNISKGDKNNGYVTLINEPSSPYYQTYTSPLSGNLIVSKTVFEGKVESKETSVESTGAFKLSISGRDEIATLLNTPVNHNYTYSQEYIYSTFSPFNTNYTDTGEDVSSISGTVITATDTVTGLVFGDVLYLKGTKGGIDSYYLLGAVKSVSGTGITLVKDSYIQKHTTFVGGTSLAVDIYKAGRALIAGKTLESSLRNTERATTLIGTADKGAVFTTGKYFNFDGTNYSDTERLSALGSGGETNGIDIDNLLNTINDSTTYFDSPLGFDFDHNTISSMVDFPVLNSVDTKDGLTLHEIGYVSPIVVGRIETDNLLDTFLETSGTAQASRKNNNIYLINGQGMPDGGFLHLLHGEINADKSPKTFNNEFEEDPLFAHTVNSQYALRFNTPIWRYVNKCAGRLTRKLFNTNTDTNISRQAMHNDFYEKDSNYNFYASGYRANIGRIPTADEHKDDTDSYRLDLPTERTGLFPVVGSRTHEITRYPTIFHNSIYHYGRRLQTDNNGISATTIFKNLYELYDNYSGPLHLFSIGDIYPESKKNPDNIGFTSGTYSRTLSDYGVVFKGEPKGVETTFNHTNWAGSTTVKNKLDDDYFYQAIQTSKGDMRRMNLVRLTDVTFDMMMNEVDYEHYKFDNRGGKNLSTILNSTTLRTDANVQIVKSFPESGFSPIDITLTSNISAGATIAVNDDSWYSSDYIFTLYTDPYDSYSENHGLNRAVYGVPLLIGQVASVNNNTVTLVTALAGLSTGVGYTSGSKLYVTVKLAAESSKAFTKKIHGANINSFPIISVTEVDNGDGVINHNYNRTMALVGIGDGNTNDAAFEDSSSNDIAEENRFPLNVDTTTIAGTLNNVNGIIKVPYIPGSATEGKHFSATSPNEVTVGLVTHRFRWNFDANFNDDVMTITNGKALQFFNSDGTCKTFHEIKTGSTQSMFKLVVGSDATYSETLLRLTGVTDTQLTFSKHASSPSSPGWSDSNETDCTLTAYEDSTTVVTSSQRLFPVRAIQDSKRGHAFAFKNLYPVIMDIPHFGLNTGSNFLGSGINCKATGGIYAVEPNKIEYYDIQVGGYSHNDGAYDVDGLEIIVHGDNAGGFATGIYENNLGGSNFAGVRPIEVLFKAFIDVDDFTVATHSGDAGLKTTEKMLITTFNIDALDNGSTSSANEWLCYSNNLTGYYLEGNNTLHKIISHTVAKDDSTGSVSTVFKHYLKIDNASSTPNGKLSLMKINQKCTYDFSPKEIHLNKASYLYTKKPGVNEMMSHIPITTATRGEEIVEDGFYSAGINKGGIQSLYTMIEPDGGGGNYLIPRTSSDISFTNSFPTGSEYDILMTDGVNSLRTSMFVSSNKILEFADMKEMKGTPSVGSILSITTVQNPNFKPKSVGICVPFNISVEVEDVADDILTSVGISYTKDTTSNNYYIGSNFTGENAYAAINNVLSFKKKKLTVDGNTIRVVSNEEEKEYRSIEFNEENNIHKVTSIKKNKSLYDNFNEVVVFGDGVKGTAKNYREIKKRGSKTKEVYDFSLVTNAQVSQKAQRLLKLYTSLQSAIEIEVGDNIPLLQPGNIVSVYYPSEGIFRGDYMVIEIEKNIGMPTKLLLGEYNRDLANTFTMLISETRNLQGRAKQKVYTSVTSPNIDIQALRVKFVKATITKTNSTATELGFTYTLGFDARMGL